EWFGAVADATGLTGVGTDNTAALQNLLTVASALKVKAVIPTGRKYRCASSSYSVHGRRVVLFYDSDLDLEVRGEIVHDAQTVDLGGPTILWPNSGNNPAPEDRKKRVHITFVGPGCISYPNDAVFAGSSRKGSITIAWTDYFSVTRVATKGTTATSFQLTVSSSTYGLIDGGMIGVPDAPSGFGDDGLHFIGGCQNIVARGGISRSGDDCLSFTQEAGDGTGTTWHDNQIMENILVSDWLCDTERAKAIKFHIDSSVRNCAIRNITMTNIHGLVRGSERGAGIAALVDHVAGSGNIIEKIRINGVNMDAGPLPKSQPDAGTDLGNLVRLQNVDDVQITGVLLRGSSNALVSMRHCRRCVVEGDFYPAGESAPLLTGVGVVSIVTQGNSNRRIALSGSPDLSAVVAQLDAFTTAAVETDYKKPIVRLTGMTGVGYNGSFVILAADDTAKWIEIENLRPGQSDET
ncbi:MAG: hypothetical protein H5U21_09240, partial [Porphyrobacter sp.]|nr:hypothetical protein [Porphyrobacter sp.]